MAEENFLQAKSDNEPKEKTIQVVNISLPIETYKKIKIFCIENNYYIKDVITKIIVESVRNQEGIKDDVGTRVLS